MIEPTAFCRYKSCSASSVLSSEQTTTPPIKSECPLRYFVAECTTISKPNSKGFCTKGEQKVLSQTAIKLLCFAKEAIAFKSAILSKGFVGVSIHIILVLGLREASKALTSLKSQKVKSKPADLFLTFSKSL